MLYVGIGDGGGGGDPERNAQDLATLLGKILRIDPAPVGRRSLRDPRRQPVRRTTTAPAPRSTPTGCATRGASRSTARPAPWRSATSARTPSRRSTSSPRGEGAGANFGWSAFEGTEPFNDDQERARRDRAGPHLRRRRRQLLGHRRLRGPRPRAAVALRPLPLRRLLRRRAAQLHRRPGGAGRDDRALGLDGRRPLELRRGQRRHDLRDLARGPVYRLDAPTR